MLTPLRLTLLLALGACSDEGPCHGGASSPILLASSARSGFERCEDGTIHRVSAEAVDPTISLPECRGDEEVMTCTTDADCTGGDHGKCVSGYTIDYQYYSHTACGCEYACASDADCQDGWACIPVEAAPELSYATCKEARCVTDATCASGTCGLSDYFDGCGQSIVLACRDPEVDTCERDAECPVEYTCAWGWDGGGWACETAGCVIGRPLTTVTGPRTAPPTTRADWSADLSPVLPDSPSRRALATHWRAVGALEHASVASFARFTLQLLALGAPPELVADTQRAAADEVRHARIAFGLAHAYDGAPIGPGRMELGDTFPSFGLEDVARALITEACVGETLGVAEALHAAAGCEDPVVAALLREIAADESRHAALAWRSLAWLLSLDPALPVATWFAEAIADIRIDEATPSRRSFGILGGLDRRAAHAAAVTEVIQPTLAQVLRSKAAADAQRSSPSPGLS